MCNICRHLIEVWVVYPLVDEISCVNFDSLCDSRAFPTHEAEEGEDVEEKDEKLSDSALPNEFVAVVAGHGENYANQNCVNCVQHS